MASNCKIIRNKETGFVEKVLAPNGKESELYKSIVSSLPEKIQLDNFIRTALQENLIKDNSKEEVALAIWSKVYSRKFKDWFGDWEKGGKNVSKVVDANGEPQLMFHGGNKGIRKFEYTSHSPGTFFSDRKDLAQRYSKLNVDIGGSKFEQDIYPVFLNIKNPFVLKNTHFTELRDKAEMAFKDPFSFIPKNADGIFQLETEDFVEDENQYIIFNSNQAKSVYNEGEFSLKDRDIYYDLSSSELSKIDPVLENKINSFLSNLGVDVKVVDKIRNSKGGVINAYGKADLTNKVIELVDGRNESTLPEEAAHMVTAMLGPKHPLMREMMNKIVNYPQYQEVKDKYKNVYSTEQEFKFEAVGKVIAESILRDRKLPGSLLSQFRDWFNRVKLVISRMLNKVDKNIPKESKNAFDIVARTITEQDNELVLNDIIHSSEIQKLVKTKNVATAFGMDEKGNINQDVNEDEIRSELDKNGLTDIAVSKSKSTGKYNFKRDGVKINPFTEYLEINDSPSQNEITNKFLESNKKLRGVVKVNGQDRYQLEDGTVLQRRVSDAQKRLFERNKTKDQIEKLQNSPKSILARETGTELHDLSENMMNYIISNDVIKNVEIGNPEKFNKEEPATPSIITRAQHVELTRSIKWLADKIGEQQQAIDPNGKARIFTENFVIDDKNSLGGSQDLLVVYSDGSVGIYDYKFINFKTQRVGRSYEVPEGTEINFMKEKSYNMQISEYKRIIQEVYGVNKVRATRILPFNIQYENKKGEFTGKVKELEGFKVDKSYLMPLPVANELTDNEYVNKVLNELFRQQKLMEDRIKNNFGTDLFIQSVNELENLKSSIKNIQVLNDFKPLFNSINLTLDNESNLMKDITVENISELNRMDSEIKLFKGLYENILVNIKDDSLKEELSNISDRLNKASVSIVNKRNKLLAEINPEINDVQKQIGALKSYFAYTSEINHPTFETFAQLMRKVHANKNKALDKLSNDLETKHEALTKWAKGRDISTFDAFKKIIKDGKLINMFSKEFYMQRDEARMNGDIDWFKENYKLAPNSNENYQNDLDKQKNVLKLTYKEDSNLYQTKLNDWINKNNLTKDSAWLNRFALSKYAEVKNQKQKYSQEYKELLSPANKPLLDYYEFYMKTNRDLNMLVDERIGSNFIANIRRDSRELLSDRSGVLGTSKQMLKDFKSGLKVYQDDEFATNSDSEMKIPLLYYNEIKVNKDGKWVTDESEKSNDLSKVLLMFADAVYKKNELVKIEGLTEALKLHLATQPVYKTDKFGKIKYDNTTGEPELDTETGKPLDLFDSHVRAQLYNEKIQNNDTIIAKEYSTNKILKSVMNYFSLNTLALSYVSAFGNLAAGTAGIFFKANGKTFFTKDQVKKTIKMMASKGDNGKYYKMSEYFNIESENWVHSKASKLSASKIVKNVTLEKAYTLWQKGENFLSNTILVSMSQNYGVNKETGKVERLDTLPEGTKSIYDMFETSGDQLNSGLTDEQFVQFRTMVAYMSRRIKGSNSTEEMSKIQTTIYGKAIMFFKNWLPTMTAERFDGIKYTKDLNEFEYGRYRSLVKSIFSGGIHKKLPKLMLDIVTFGKLKYSASNEELEAHFEQFLKRNPDMKGKIDLMQYMDLRERTIREAIAEMRTLTGMMLLLMAAKADWDDDGEEDYKKSAATKHTFRLVRRMYLELSFFSNPMSFTEITRNPIPIVSIGTDLIKSFNNGFDETLDIVMDNERDKTGYLHHLKKLSPGKPLFRVFEDFQN